VIPTVPTAAPSCTIGNVIPGRTPMSRRASSAVCAAAVCVFTTSTDASWKVPTRDWSPLPITMPSASVMMMLRPMMALVSPAISWASAGVRNADPAAAVKGTDMYEPYHFGAHLSPDVRTGRLMLAPLMRS